MSLNDQRRGVLLYSNGMFDFRVFSRLRPGLEARGWTLLCVTHLLSVWMMARLAGIPCTLLRASPRSVRQPTVVVGQTHEGRLQHISEPAARRFEQSAWDALERTIQRFNVRAIAQWNGLGLGGRVATAFARQHGLGTLYLELGNLEQKLFADPEGVNAASAIARRPELLDLHDVSDVEIASWRKDFIKRGQGEGQVPQALRMARVNPWFAVDKFGAGVLRIPMPVYIPIVDRVTTVVRLLLRRPTDAVAPPRRFVFLPLQVSTDTNPLLFSDHDNRSALKAAAAIAREAGVVLVVKPHPAERDQVLLDALRAESLRAGHVWTSFNTIDLILGAERVVTINSTVGLIARVLDRPVTILGKSLYTEFSTRQAAVYALRHLIDLNPFGRLPAHQDVADRIIAILDTQDATAELGQVIDRSIGGLDGAALAAK